MRQKPVVSKRISFRVAFLLAVLAVVIGSVAGAIQIGEDFRDERRRLDEATEAILATAVYPAAWAVHTLDDVLADEVIKGLTRRSFVVSAQILDERGRTLAAGSQGRETGTGQPSWLPAEMGVRRHDVALSLPGGSESGRLIIEVDEPSFFASFLERSVNTALGELVKASLFALVAFLVLRITVTAPLFRLAAWFAGIDPARPGDVPGPVPMGGSHNEFGLLARAGDTFRTSISSLMQDKARYEAELEGARDRLESLVVERTQALADEIEERKAAQQSLQDTNANLERLVAERTARLSETTEEAVSANAAKTVFLANMSHELRTPLNSVIGFSQVMAGEMFGPLPARYREYVDIVIRSGEHLLRLIEDVLDMSKVESGRIALERSAVDPAALVGEVVAMVSEQAHGNGVRLSSELARCDQIEADPTRLKQVVLNLLSNAIKFSPQGEVVAAVRTDATHCHVVVRDTGIGMSPEDIEIALLPFGQAEKASAQRRFQGTGLGLPIAKRLVELHGGSLSIGSTPGAGTTVCVLLPRQGVASQGGLASSDEEVPALAESRARLDRH